MKNIFKNLIAILILSGIVVSCDDDNTIIENDDTDLSGGLQVVKYNFKSKKGTSGRVEGTAIAVFDSELTYNNYIEQLEAEVEAWDDAFVAEWNHLSDDELDAKEEELNFDSEKPLTDFENQNGLYSLRQKYIDAENEWLKDDILDDSKDPELNPLFNFDESEMAILNNLAEVKIAGKIYKQLSEDEIQAVNEFQLGKGISKRIEEGNEAMMVIDEDGYDTLIAFNEGDVSVVNNSNVDIIQPTTIDCEYGKSVRKDFSISSNRKIRCVVKVPQPKFGSNGKLKAKVKSLKKGTFGWKRSRANLSARLVGEYFDTSCSNSPIPVDFTNTSSRRKSKRKIKVKNPHVNSHIVEDGGLKGVFTRNGVTKELVLQW
jgi:hypothetical protein